MNPKPASIVDTSIFEYCRLLDMSIVKSNKNLYQPFFNNDIVYFFIAIQNIHISKSIFIQLNRETLTQGHHKFQLLSVVKYVFSFCLPYSFYSKTVSTLSFAVIQITLTEVLYKQTSK